MQTLDLIDPENQKSTGVRSWDRRGNGKEKWREMMRSQNAVLGTFEQILLYVQVHHLASKRCHLVHFTEAILAWHSFTA